MFYLKNLTSRKDKYYFHKDKKALPSTLQKKIFIWLFRNAPKRYLLRAVV